jgi:hypothetical protein
MLTEKKRRRLSFSSITTLIKSPKEFYKKYIEGIEEVDQKHFVDGQLFHALLLERDTINEKFMMQSAKLPSANPKAFCDWYFNYQWVAEKGIVGLGELNVETLAWIKEQGLYDKMTDPIKLSRIQTPEAIDYFRALQEANIKKVPIVTYDSVATMTAKADAVLDYDKAHHNFFEQTNQKQVCRNEMDVTCNMPEWDFDLRGIVDRLKVDYEKCVLQIVDLKKTERTLQEWKEFSFDTYHYFLQPPIYKKLVESLIPKNSKDKWKIEFYFLVCDKNNDVYAFKVSEESMHKWTCRMNKSFDTVQWHLRKQEFNLPKEYALGEVEL